MRGKFITLEGMDGAGKSTHIPYILDHFHRRGLQVVSTREPGGTVLGERLRELLLHEAMHAETEALLMFAARKEHLVQVIEPALAAGAYVISDRFSDASYAYQCGGRGVEFEKMHQLEHWVQGQLQPDVTLLFDVPVEVSLQRLVSTRAPDKFEQEGEGFFTRIREAYLLRAKLHPHRFRIIDSNQAMDDVVASLEKILVTI